MTAYLHFCFSSLVLDQLLGFTILDIYLMLLFVLLKLGLQSHILTVTDHPSSYDQQPDMHNVRHLTHHSPDAFARTVTLYSGLPDKVWRMLE
jgi:hypothetical protein